MGSRLWRAVEAWNYWKRKPATGVPREVSAKILTMVDGHEAVFLYGPRRAGKTTVCLQLLERLSVVHGSRSCLYLNFEEPVFASRLDAGLIEDMVGEFAGEFGREPEFVFLDEVQNVALWERWVRTAVDRKRFKVFVTGSSAKLLSSEFSTSLGGRGLGFLVMPFSWREFKAARSDWSFKDYLAAGGYPAVVLQADAEKRRLLLNEYFETAVARDVALRFGVRDVQALRSLAAYVLTNSGSMVSYNKLRGMTGLSFDAIRAHLEHLQDAFLVFQVPHFSYSLKKALEKPRKYYAVDLGMQAAISQSFSPDEGRRLENAVASELLARGASFYYYRNRHEVDFVVRKGRMLEAINVCSSKMPPQREAEGLAEFAEAHGKAATRLLAGEGAVRKWVEEGAA